MPIANEFGTPMKLRLPSAAGRLLVVFLATISVASPCLAQQPPADQVPAPPPTSPEIDLTLVNLPTTLGLRRHRSYFRLTHRFARDLRRGDFGSLVEDLFSLDNGAIIGLEYRFGIMSDLEAGVHRSLLSKTIQVFGKYDRWKQGDKLPVSISVIASLEGLDNLTEDLQPGIVATISRSVGNWLMLYTSPGFVANSHAPDILEGHDHGLPPGVVDEHANHDDTMFVGLGGRVRLRPSVFVAGEFTPRVTGYDPGRGIWGVAVEKRTRGGGHVLQLNFTNSFGTTFGQIARGGSEHDVYLGFNITRKF
jgi:uncharacterized beta barrel domain-containing protein DUF5777